MTEASLIPMDQMIEMTTSSSCKKIESLSGQTKNAGASESWAKIDNHLVEKTQNMSILNLVH